MRRFKKVMLMTSVVSGIGLTAAGAAQAEDCGGKPPHPPAGNVQSVDCDQEFRAGLITVNVPVTVLGDSVTNIGNFCPVIAPGR
ncbi:hypothetical protein ABZX30_10035 [Streptomyces sp. NPDC004542]|uniref:hypothetical protein n=1 Tax=Streptomyces sp. NPDC004542 TaxID=3154281 RepID=UPI0033AECD3B